jgi:hypothetical protein
MMATVIKPSKPTPDAPTSRVRELLERGGQIEEAYTALVTLLVDRAKSELAGVVDVFCRQTLDEGRRTADLKLEATAAEQQIVAARERVARETSEAETKLAAIRAATVTEEARLEQLRTELGAAVQGALR